MPQRKSEIIVFVHCSPGGNDTYLCFPHDWSSSHSYLDVDAAIRGQFKAIEQGGFLEASTGNAIVRLQMAGGEFCVNALRALGAYILAQYWAGFKRLNCVNYSRIRELSDAEVEFLLESSGAEDPVLISCSKLNDGYYTSVEFPLSDSINKQQHQLVFRGVNYDVVVVHLPGISHVLLNQELHEPLVLDDAKEFLLQCEAQLGVDRCAAIGLIWYQAKEKRLRIDPVVFVRLTGSLVRETACGSGSIALALLCYLRDGESSLVVEQPSGEPVSCSITSRPDGKLSVRIGGQVRLVGFFQVEVPDKDVSP